ncbi:hypothetical protein NPIL_252461 [Nephila pilipes]|uniref:Uncharacterized protein n=1 Tax=Nephila pilipes TaxID=299642 RepID=A0A8X6NZN6_NEPPI|nr:hypothetical protein NPIL_252461 [Nephila pilipes]
MIECSVMKAKVGLERRHRAISRQDVSHFTVIINDPTRITRTPMTLGTIDDIRERSLSSHHTLCRKFPNRAHQNAHLQWSQTCSV